MAARHEVMKMPEDREEEEQQESYHKVDQRVGREKEEPAEEPAEAPAEEPRRPAGPPAGEEEAAAEPEGDEAAEAPGEEAMQIDMYGLLRMMFGMCVEQAWVHLGLQLAPGAKETKADLPQARLAIDTIAYIKDGLGDNLQDAEKREVEQILTTLRMNFVQRT
jgi:hypothetical protein